MKNKFGIVLTGGGSRGAYQLGVWKALKELKLDTLFSAYSGISIGSLNSCLMATDSYDEAYNVWFSDKPKEIMSINHNMFDRIHEKKLNIFNEGLVDADKFGALIDENLNYKKLKKKDVFVSSSLIGGKESNVLDIFNTWYHHFFKKDKNMLHMVNLKNLDKEHILKNLLASCALIVIFKPQEIDGQKFYDGGFINNTVYEPLFDIGCNKVLVVDLFKYNPARLVNKNDNILFLKPSRSLRNPLDFDQKLTKYRYELGYKDMMNLYEEHKSFFSKK